MSDKVSKAFDNLKKEPKGKSIIGAIDKCLKQLDEQDGALLMHLWAGHHLNALEFSFSHLNLNMMEYTSNSWDKNEAVLDEQAVVYFNEFSERFKDLFRVMKFIENKYPQLLEMPNLEEKNSNKKILVQYLSFRESTLFSTGHFSMANLYKEIADGFYSWDFRSVLEQWAQNDVPVIQEEQDVLLQAAFSVDKKAHLNCIKKWWQPEEELACNMDPTVRFAVHPKYTEKYVNIIRKNDVDKKTEAAFYNYAMWHGCLGCLNGSVNFKNSSLHYILGNTFSHEEEKSSLVYDYSVIAQHIQKSRGVQFAESQKMDVVKELLVAAAKEKTNEYLENTFENLLEVLQEEGRVLGNTTLLNPSCRSENIDIVFSMEMHGYFDALDENREVDQHFLKSDSGNSVEKNKPLEQYFKDVKELSPTLFYVLSDFLSEPTYGNRMVELKKILNEQTLGDDWDEKFRLPVNAQLLNQWIQTTMDGLTTGNGPQDNVELIFETIKELAPAKKITHLMPLVFDEKTADIQHFLIENGLDSSLMTPIVSLVEELKGAESSQKIHDLFHKYYLNTNVKTINKTPNKPLLQEARF